MVIAYIAVGILPIACELLRRTFAKHLTFDSLTFFNLYFLLTYSLTPLLILLDFPLDLPLMSILSDYFPRGATPFLLMGGYVVAVSGWWIGSSGKMLNTQQRRIGVSRLKLMITAVLVVHIGCLVIFANAYGGLGTALLLGDAIRYGQVEGGLGVLAARFLFIGQFTLLYCYYKISLDRRYLIDRKFFLCAFLVLVSVEIILMPIRSGRGYVINTVMAIYGLKVLSQKSWNLNRVVIVMPLVFVIIMYGKQLFFGFPLLLEGQIDAFLNEFARLSDARLTSDFPVLGAIARETSHGIVSLEVALAEGGSTMPFTFFRDFVLILPWAIPTKALGLTLNLPDSVSFMNTVFLTNMAVSSIPPGLVGHFAYSLGKIGIIIGMFFYGLIGGVLERRIRGLVVGSPGAVVLYWFFISLYGQFVSNGDPKVYFFSSGFGLGLIIFCCYFASVSERRQF